jgi:peroxiredoxin
LRHKYEEIVALGGDVVAVGTGDVRYAKAFVEDQRIPYLVLVDSDGAAARVAQVRDVRWSDLVHPRIYAGVLRAAFTGNFIGKPGPRQTQLGATFVIGPGNAERYAWIDRTSVDHAPMAEVMAALASGPGKSRSARGEP